MSSRGRPTKSEYGLKQATTLRRLGASEKEIEVFFSDGVPGDEEWCVVCLVLIRQDRRGVFADQKEKRSRTRRAWLGKNPSQRIRNSVTARMWAALKGRSDGKLFSRLGYTADELVRHLEKQFVSGMSWDNYGQWHIDHIKPCALFDLTDEGQFNECWALNNLQPLWASENVKKGTRHAS